MTKIRMNKRNSIFQNSITMAFVICFISVSVLLRASNDTSLTCSQVPSPINSNLKKITFINNNLGFAVGDQILLYKNGTWRIFPNHSINTIDLFTVIDSTSFFITKSSINQESDLYFAKEGHFSKISHPLANSITSLFFKNRNFGILGGYGEVALYKNKKWEIIPPYNNIPVTHIFLDNDTTIWAQLYQTGLYKYKTSWKKIKNSNNITDFQFHKNKCYVLGIGFIGVVQNDSVTYITTDNILMENSLNAFFVLDKNEFIVVGQNGVILHFKSNKWTQIKSNIENNLQSVWMNSKTDGWVAGSNGLLLHLSDTTVAFPHIPKQWNGFKRKTILAPYSKITDDEYGVVIADFNNDNFPDIFTCGLFESNHLYINNGNNSFTDKAVQWHIEGDIIQHKLNLGACAGDFDNDGDMDLYISSLNSSNNYYMNIDGEYFVDFSKHAGEVTGKENDRTNAVISGDVDNDGDLDIFIANETGSNRLFLNNGAGIFNEVTESVGLTTSFGGMGCSFGDIDNDGDLDLYVANWSTKNFLYKNLLKEKGSLEFKNITDIAKVGGNVYTKSNAVVFADIDNDADLDLFVTNRKNSNKLYINNGNGIFEDKTKDMIGADSLKSYGVVIADFDGDGSKDIYLSNVGFNTFYKNIEGKQFVDKTIRYGINLSGYSTGSAVTDLNNNGSIDLYVANYFGESSSILENNQSPANYIKIKTEGIENNRNGIGSKIYVYKQGELNHNDALIYYTEINGGSGYASMNQMYLPISIQDNQSVDVKVVFPNGIIKTRSAVKSGNDLIIQDVTGFTAITKLVQQKLKIIFYNPQNLFNLLSILIAVILIISYSIRLHKKYKWKWFYILANALFLFLLFYYPHNYFSYKNIWLSNILPVISVFIFILLTNFYSERKKIKIISDTEKEQLRKKLSRDLHDDLASTISTIGIYLTLMRYNLKEENNKLTQLLNKTDSLIGGAASSITDLIWAITPKSETLDNLIIRINKNFANLFREKNINYFVDSAIDLEKVTLNDQIKQNVYLIIKEALNNTLKYSQASEVTITVNKKQRNIILTIKDNGTGFNINSVKNRGHGLTNMRIRAEEIKAKFILTSNKSKGTTISINFKPN